MSSSDTNAASLAGPTGVCPKCARSFFDRDILHCPDDGEELETAGPSTHVDRIVGGRYRILGLLGEGGMGTVYTGENTLTYERVALKIIRQELESSGSTRERFLLECEMLDRIDSPHVVKVYESGQSKAGEIYLVMELLEGENLGDRLDRVGRLSASEAASIGTKIAAALVAAHSAGVVHRDLKPDNIFLCKDGSLRVLDFGISRLLDGQTLEGASARRLTATGAIIGTPAYISPESVAGLEIGPAVDLYSLGVMLFEMVAGDLPFWDEQAVLLMGMHLKEPAPNLMDHAAVTQEFADLVGQMLAKDAKDRPASAAEVQRCLGEAASGVHVRPPPPDTVREARGFEVVPIPNRSRSGPRRSPWLIPLAISLPLLGLSIGGGGAWWAIQSGTSEDAPVTVLPSAGDISPTELAPPEDVGAEPAVLPEGVAPEDQAGAAPAGAEASPTPAAEEAETDATEETETDATEEAEPSRAQARRRSGRPTRRPRPRRQVRPVREEPAANPAGGERRVVRDYY